MYVLLQNTHLGMYRFSTEYCGNKRLHHQSELKQEFSLSLISKVEIE